MRSLYKKFIVAFFVLTCLCANVFAEPKVIDEVGLLTKADIAELEAQVRDFILRCEMDMVVLLVNDIGADPKYSANDYGYNYLRENGYGIGDGREAVMLLYVHQDGRVGYRRAEFITSGIAATEALDKYTDKLIDKFIDKAIEGQYAEGVSAFIAAADELANPRIFTVLKSLIASGASAIVALFKGLSVKNSYKVKSKPKVSYNYNKFSSLGFASTNDAVISSNTTSRTIATSSSSSGRSSGRSGGGGASRGGGGRSF